MVNTRSKTLPAYIDGHGRTRSIVRQGRMWYVDSGHGFSHMDMVKDWLKREGYTFTRVPNRNYRPDPLPTFSKIMRGFGL